MSLISFGFDRRTTHVGFADEAYWNRGKFRSVACVSARARDYLDIERRLCIARCAAGARVSEIKWSELNDYERQRDAESVLRAIVELAIARKLRIDVVIWNNLDREDLARARDTDEEVDVWNLRNMYRTLFGFLMRRWQALEGARPVHWTFGTHYPAGLNRDLLEQQTRVSGASPGTRVDIQRAKSALNYSVQLADLLAGLGTYSHSNWEDYGIWLRQDKPRDLTLTARNARHRFPVMDAFINRCGPDLGVSLLQNKPGWQGQGFWTSNPFDERHAINFLPYTMRHGRTPL